MHAFNPNGTKPTPPSRQQSLIIQLGNVGYMDHTGDSVKNQTKMKTKVLLFPLNITNYHFFEGRLVAETASTEHPIS